MVRKNILNTVEVFFWLGIFGTGWVNADILWGIDGKKFDQTNKNYPIDSGRVIVDLQGSEFLCPTGLGHLVSGRESITEIEFRFMVDKAGQYWLHLQWHPGGSGREQFEMICNGQNIGRSSLRDGSEEPYYLRFDSFRAEYKKGENSLILRHLSGDGLHFNKILLNSGQDIPHVAKLKPNLRFSTLSAFEKASGETGVFLDSDNVCLFAPKRTEKAARIVFPYLVNAYDELHKLVGRHTKHKIVVYHFPKGNKHGWGGTSECAIWYDESNLHLENFEEWKCDKVPHVSGYIEEMAHNFVSSTHAQFGWEMIGWSISINITEKIAYNPIFRNAVKQTRRTQIKTFQRYKKGCFVFPTDIAPNLCDRIHAYILMLAENQYGMNFWKDFFIELQKEQLRLHAASHSGTDDERRNERYRITVECFDRLEGLEFKRLLELAKISLTVDIKSLHPEKPDWNRKFIE